MHSEAESLTLYLRDENHHDAGQSDQSEMRDASGAGEDELD